MILLRRVFISRTLTLRTSATRLTGSSSGSESIGVSSPSSMYRRG